MIMTRWTNYWTLVRGFESRSNRSKMKVLCVSKHSKWEHKLTTRQYWWTASKSHCTGPTLLISVFWWITNYKATDTNKINLAQQKSFTPVDKENFMQEYYHGDKTKIQEAVFSLTSFVIDFYRSWVFVGCFVLRYFKFLFNFKDGISFHE